MHRCHATRPPSLAQYRRSENGSMLSRIVRIAWRSLSSPPSGMAKASGAFACTNPRFRSRNASWLYPIVGRTRKHSLHRWAQFLPRDERLYPPPARPEPPQGWRTLTAQVSPSGLSAQAMDARNPLGSYRLPTPRRLPQRIRLPFQPAKVRFARQALLPVGTARAPDRPDDLRKAGAATRC